MNSKPSGGSIVSKKRKGEKGDGQKFVVRIGTLKILSNQKNQQKEKCGHPPKKKRVGERSHGP